RICVAAVSDFAAFRPSTAIFAPASASPRAMPRPIPPLPPVTIATLPVRSNSFTARSLSPRPLFVGSSTPSVTDDAGPGNGPADTAYGRGRRGLERPASADPPRLIAIAAPRPRERSDRASHTRQRSPSGGGAGTRQPGRAGRSGPIGTSISPLGRQL